MLPRLHVVTNDSVLADPGFPDRAAALMETHGSHIALHLRSPEGPVRRLLETAELLLHRSEETDTPVLVNDRPDVALALGAAGVHLGSRSIPVQAVRFLLGGDPSIGYSAHGASEAASALANGADFVAIGTIWETASHPHRSGAGLQRVRETVAAADGPVLAIGGVTPGRTREAVAAGAWGVAVVRGVWEAADPVEAAGEYLREIGVGSA